jgi:alpha-glucosidase
MMLLSLRGTPVFFEGDEIGLEDSELERDDVLDPVGLRFWPVYKGRDPERGPVPWKPGPGGGFTEPGVRTWLPMRDPSLNNIASQRGHPASVLNFVHDLIALRRSTPALALGDSAPVPSPDGCWAWRRGGSATVVLNMSDVSAEVVVFKGTIRCCTDRSREGEKVAETLSLAAWTGAIVIS